MAAVIAQFPIPVLTAIGHDQDFHVCDMVAHEYVKTPTALADFIIGIYEDEDARLSSYQARLKLAFGGRISAAEAKIEMLRSRIRGAFALKMSSMEAALGVLETRIKAADPKKVLERGYVLAVDGDGVVIKGAGNIAEGDKVSVMFADGTLDCTVDRVR